MFERFTKEARTVVKDAEVEARQLGSPTIEAEHLLLAIARRPETAAGSVLHAAGLDRAAIREALDMETERSLMAVGISAGGLEPPASRVATLRSLRMAASAKLALERSLREALVAGDRRIESIHVLLGILRARVGTVPRLLEAAGVDRDRLVAATGDR